LISVDDFFNSRLVRGIMLKLRLPLGLAVLVWVFYAMNPAWFWPGLAVSVLGALGQLWCFACIRTQQRLAAAGPYMFVRNPMYLARYFLILGVLLWTGNLWVIGAFTVSYYPYMNNRVRREEARLREIFGQPYEEYCRDVNRFLPTFNKRFRPALLVKTDLECFRRNHGFTNILAVAVIYALAYYSAYVFPYPFR